MVIVSVTVTESPLALTVAVADKAVVNNGTPLLAASKMPMALSTLEPEVVYVKVLLKVYVLFALELEKVCANVAGARPRPLVVSSLARDVSVAATVPVVIPMYQAGAFPGMMMNDEFAAGVVAAAPVGDAGLYHLSTVSAVAVFEVITPYAMALDVPPPAAQMNPVHTFAEPKFDVVDTVHDGDAVGVTVVAV